MAGFQTGRMCWCNGWIRKDFCESSVTLLRDLAFGLICWIFDLSLEAFQQPLQEGLGIGLLATGLELVGERDVASEVGQDDAPGEWVFPRAGAEADVLAL